MNLILFYVNGFIINIKKKLFYDTYGLNYYFNKILAW